MPVKDISLEDVRQVRDELKKLDSKWMTQVIEEMAKEEPGIDKVKVYNITSNVLRDQRYRRMFITACDIVLKKLRKEQSAATRVVDKLQD